MSKKDFEKFFVENKERFIDELQTLIKFKSVGTETAHHQDCCDCADWLKDHLANIGFKAELLDIPGAPPLVFAEYIVDQSKPTVLLYGHYDVQPAGDESLWDYPPFEPFVKDGRIHGRGARDNKGQFFFSLKAYEALISLGCLDFNVKVLIDGQEESGSLLVLSYLETWKDKLSCDLLMSSETQGLPDGTPSIILGFRGLSYMRVNVYGPKGPVHSGHYGGIVRNPAVELSKLVAGIFNEDGTIALPGFYDDVKLPSDQEREFIARGDFDEAEYFDELGVDAFMGNPEYTPKERVAFFPTIEFPGIAGGYVGRSAVAAIPAFAQLKLTLRTAREQDPKRCLDILEEYFISNAPAGVRLEIEVRGTVCEASFTDLEVDYISKAHTLLTSMFGEGVGVEWNGATIPAIAVVKELVNCETLLVGFGQLGDSEHGPNESFSLAQFEKGFLYTCRYLSNYVC